MAHWSRGGFDGRNDYVVRSALRRDSRHPIDWTTAAVWVLPIVIGWLAIACLVHLIVDAFTTHVR